MKHLILPLLLALSLMSCNQKSTISGVVTHGSMPGTASKLSLYRAEDFDDSHYAELMDFQSKKNGVSITDAQKPEFRDLDSSCADFLGSLILKKSIDATADGTGRYSMEAPAGDYVMVVRNGATGLHFSNQTEVSGEIDLAKIHVPSGDKITKDFAFYK